MCLTFLTPVYVSPTAMEMSSCQKYQMTQWGTDFFFFPPCLSNLRTGACNLVYRATHPKLFCEWLFEPGKNEIVMIYMLIPPCPRPK